MVVDWLDWLISSKNIYIELLLMRSMLDGPIQHLWWWSATNYITIVCNRWDMQRSFLFFLRPVGNKFDSDWLKSIISRICCIVFVWTARDCFTLFSLLLIYRKYTDKTKILYWQNMVQRLLFNISPVISSPSYIRTAKICRF